MGSSLSLGERSPRALARSFASSPAIATRRSTVTIGMLGTAATGSSAADAYVRAREADSLSAFGAAVALNRPIDVETARAIVSTRIDAVIAPSVEDHAGPFPVIAKELIGHVDNSSFPAIAVDIHMVLVTPAWVKSAVPVMIMFGRAALPSAPVPAQFARFECVGRSHLRDRQRPRGDRLTHGR